MKNDTKEKIKFWVSYILWVLFIVAIIYLAILKNQILKQ